jgi:hypothetical protein
MMRGVLITWLIAAIASADIYGHSQVPVKPTTDAGALAKAREKGNKKRAEKKFYTKEFDLSGLPE